MANQAMPAYAVMEGAGVYNLYSQIPAGGGMLALPYLERAVREVTLPATGEPIVIADYGSSQGKNSMTPMRLALKGVRTRLGPDRPVLIVHVDQAANDFNTLFGVLHSDPQRYSQGDPNVFPSAIGRSFYESVFPSEYVHLGWSSYAAVWLSRIPMRIPGHFVVVAAQGEVRAAFDRQGAEDWELFLSLRARELRSGARLVVVLPGLNDEGSGGFEPLFREANEALQDMLAEGSLPAEDRAAMVVGAYPRRRSQLLAPFAADGQFHGLRVEHCDLAELTDTAWTDFQRDGNNEALTDRHVGFFRAIFLPSLASAITDEPRRNAFVQRFDSKLRQRLAERPVPYHSFAQIVVMAKQGPQSAEQRQS
jgi:SAM dependent carboxyl methyltransferase